MCAVLCLQSNLLVCFCFHWVFTLHELINVTVTGLDVGDGCVKLLRGCCSVGLHTVSVLVCILVQCWSAYGVYTNT